jgi:hypothetical protein
MASVIIPHFCSILRFLGRPRLLTRLAGLPMGRPRSSVPQMLSRNLSLAIGRLSWTIILPLLGIIQPAGPQLVRHCTSLLSGSPTRKPQQEGYNMDSMDNFRERFEALEQRTEQLKQQTQALEAQSHTLARQARWWRGIACGLGLLGLVSLPLRLGTAADTQPRGMTERMATLENKLSAMTFDGAANEVVIAGANLRIVNGLGGTETTNGLGNLIVGYNEERGGGYDNRTGSHNVVIGSQHNFSSFGGLIVGTRNGISGRFASVSGGLNNTASGDQASVSGGFLNTASGDQASVSGGFNNTASEFEASVSGGVTNTASGNGASVSGGLRNTAEARGSSISGGIMNRTNDIAGSVFSAPSISGGADNLATGIGASISGGRFNIASGTAEPGSYSSVSGGLRNFADGDYSSVCGGNNNLAAGAKSSVSGGSFNRATGDDSSVSGGHNNTASGNFSSVSGGANRIAPGTEDWTAGPLFADN